MQRKTYCVLLAVIVGLLALRLWHIRADFPDYRFYGQEGAQFTDEGFYSSAALSHFTLGRAYIPGGWNPGVFMPVWPFLVGLLFHFTGVGVAAARSLAVVCTWLTALLAYAVARQYRPPTFSLMAAFLFAANALGFFYSRLAILESAFVLCLLLAVYLAGKVRPGGYGMAVAVGVAFTVMTLTKTTGPFVLPAVLYPIWARNRGHRAAAWKLVAVAASTAIVLLACAKFVWAHHYPEDSKIILGMNPLWQLENSPSRLLRFFLRGTWIDPVLFPLALAAFIAALVKLRFLWRDTLFTTAFLWEMGYAAFIVFHYDGPPRYFVALIVPTIWLALVFTEWLWRQHRQAGVAVAACIVISACWNLGSIGAYLARPRYTLIDAAQGIKRTIIADSAAHSLLIGRGADEISLLSGGLPTMDSDGAMPLAEKIEVYHPGWFIGWSGDVPLRMETVASKRRLVLRASFQTMDSSRHATVTLYELLPLPAGARP
ncbi:MAG: ArnT family glycosyltransferase [Acidobacteriaceae bacterium]